MFVVHLCSGCKAFVVLFVFGLFSRKVLSHRRSLCVLNYLLNLEIVSAAAFTCIFAFCITTVGTRYMNELGLF